MIYSSFWVIYHMVVQVRTILRPPPPVPLVGESKYLRPHNPLYKGSTQKSKAVWPC